MNFKGKKVKPQGFPPWVKMSEIKEKIELSDKDIPRSLETYKTHVELMNEDNKKAVVVMATHGLEAGMDYMISGGVEGQQLSYAEMRARYG